MASIVIADELRTSVGFLQRKVMTQSHLTIEDSADRKAGELSCQISKTTSRIPDNSSIKSVHCMKTFPNF